MALSDCPMRCAAIASICIDSATRRFAPTVRPRLAALSAQYTCCLKSLCEAAMFEAGRVGFENGECTNLGQRRLGVRAFAGGDLCPNQRESVINAIRKEAPE